MAGLVPGVRLQQVGGREDERLADQVWLLVGAAHQSGDLAAGLLLDHLHEAANHDLLEVGTLLDDRVASPFREQRLLLRLFAAGALGEWQELAAVDVERRASDEQELRFNPWTTGGGIEPVGALMGLRDPAYRASQAAAPRS